MSLIHIPCNNVDRWEVEKQKKARRPEKPKVSQSDEGTSSSEQEEIEVILYPCEHVVIMSTRGKLKFCSECGKQIQSSQKIKN